MVDIDLLHRFGDPAERKERLTAALPIQKGDVITPAEILVLHALAITEAAK
jgi:hypothetical protein